MYTTWFVSVLCYLELSRARDHDVVSGYGVLDEVLRSNGRCGGGGGGKNREIWATENPFLQTRKQKTHRKQSNLKYITQSENPKKNVCG